jgi:hypothetical protein
MAFRRNSNQQQGGAIPPAFRDPGVAVGGRRDQKPLASELPSFSETDAIMKPEPILSAAASLRFVVQDDSNGQTGKVSDIFRNELNGQIRKLRSLRSRESAYRESLESYPDNWRTRFRHGKT